MNNITKHMNDKGKQTCKGILSERNKQDDRFNMDDHELDEFDMDIEEFDSLDGDHHFSENYKDKKAELLRGLHRKDIFKKRILRFSIAACIAIIATPITINAATGGELFARLWGNKGHRSVERHTEVLEKKENGTEITVEFPERDYVEVDEEKASELIGGDIQQFEPYTYTAMDGTKISVTSIVSDGNAAVAEIILENVNGVQGFCYNDLYNESKGAYFSMDACIDISFDGAGHRFYVDLDNSTSERIVCYAYIGFLFSKYEGERKFPIVVYDYPYPQGAIKGYQGYEDYKISEDHENTKIDRYDFHLEDILDKNIFSGDKGFIEISPISMKITFNDGIDRTQTYSIRIIYKDDSEYDVLEKSVHGHENDKFIDNTSNYMGGSSVELCLFNRLVNVDEIKEIYVNDISYKPSERKPVLDVGVDAKIDLYESVEELENDAACIVIGKKTEEVDSVCKYDCDGSWIGGYTLSDFEISEVLKDDSGKLTEGSHITVLENQVFDEKTNRIYHIADYTAMNTSDEYVLFLSHNKFLDGRKYYTPLAAVFGITSLGDDYTMKSYGLSGNDDVSNLYNSDKDSDSEWHKEVNSLREKIREKINTR